MSTKRAAKTKALDDTAAASVPVAVPTPPEEHSAIALRERFAAFNADAADRSRLTADDRASLADIDSLTAAYLAEARDAWRVMEWGSQTCPDVVNDLPNLITTYTADTDDEQVVKLASGRSKTYPAIESTTYRGALVRDGAAILARIDACIAAGYARLARSAELEQKYTANVRSWLTEQPLVRQLVAALAATVDSAPDMMTPRDGLLQTLRSTQQSILGEADRNGGVALTPLFNHEWRKWLPIARRILTETA